MNPTEEFVVSLAPRVTFSLWSCNRKFGSSWGWSGIGRGVGKRKGGCLPPYVGVPQKLPNFAHPPDAAVASPGSHFRQPCTKHTPSGTALHFHFHYHCSTYHPLCGGHLVACNLFRNKTEIGFISHKIAFKLVLLCTSGFQTVHWLGSQSHFCGYSGLSITML